jgi:DNA-directed RNA polymerase subunit M/transcription elongation factor TFIIS
LYRRMTVDELMDLARNFSSLSNTAKPLVQQELRVRGLKMPSQAELTPPSEPASDDPYDEDRELVTLCGVWSLADAKQLEYLLNRSDIPFFMGAENATKADTVTSSFSAGVDVKVMRVGVLWAQQALQYYEPEDEPKISEEAEVELVVQCPKCGSEEVVFGDETTTPEAANGPRSNYQWSCDSCGHRWIDDGVAKEK